MAVSVPSNQSNLSALLDIYEEDEQGEDDQHSRQSLVEVKKE